MNNAITIEAINQHLDEHPTDWQTRAELADFLDDVGLDKQAALQRWLIEYKRSPLIWETVHQGTYPWHWWIRNHDHRYKESVLGNIAELIPFYLRGYVTRMDAEIALRFALDKYGWPLLEVG